MAKKVIAKLKDQKGKNFAKVIIPTKSEKTGAYKFNEKIVPLDEVKTLLAGF